MMRVDLVVSLLHRPVHDKLRATLVTDWYLTLRIEAQPEVISTCTEDFIFQ